jgi:hypothetical protein
LNVINENKAISQIYTGEKLVKDKPTISRMVNQLEALYATTPYASCILYY